MNNRLILAFDIDKDMPLKPLLELGYERVVDAVKKRAIARKGLGDGSVTVIKEPARIIVIYDGDLSECSNAHFVIDNIYSDLREIGLVKQI